MSYQGYLNSLINDAIRVEINGTVHDYLKVYNRYRGAVTALYNARVITVEEWNEWLDRWDSAV